MMSPLDTLRNMKLNAAFAPPGEPPNYMNPVTVPQGNTQFDPFQGSGWGRMFDAMGASEPGGTRMAMQGLQGAGPQTAAPARPPALVGGPGQASAEHASALQRYLRGGQ